MNKIIPIMGMLSVNLFFAISSIIGYTYIGIEDSKLFLIYSIVIAILNLGICLSCLVNKKNKIMLKELIILSFPLIIFIDFLITGAINNNGFNSFAKTFFSYFLLWCVPAIYAGVYVNKANIFKLLTKWFDIVMIIFSLSIIISSIITVIEGKYFTSMGGASYLTASYAAGFAYGLNLYFIFYGDNHERFRFTKSKMYRILCILLIIIQLSGIFISGGRGGIVLVAVYTIYISFSVLKSKRKKIISKYFLIVIIMIAFVTIGLSILLKNEIFAGGFRRVFQFISPTGGIEWEGTSGRDQIYTYVIHLIQEKPFLGYGLFGFWEVSGYPHNIILEILLNGGITYLIFTFGFFLKFFIKLFRMIKFEAQNRLIMIFILFPITMLMFSGTYMNSSELWFVLSLVFSYKTIQKT